MLALFEWARDNDVTITVADQLPAGLTPAWLFSMYVEGPAIGVRKMVVKVLPAQADLGHEPGRHRQALDADRGFAERHLVAQAFAPVPMRDGGWLLLLDIAGHSLRDAGPLALIAAQKAEWYRLEAICGPIVAGVLGGWNAGCASREWTVRDFLAAALGPADGPDSLASRDSWIRLPGEPQDLPNPVALVDGRLCADRRLRCLTGQRHGDLHAGNIVVPLAADRDGEGFWLIDLCEYEPAGLLALDPCFLAATLAIGWLDEIDGYAGSELIDLLLEPGRAAGRRVPVPLRRALSAIGRAGLDWATAGGRGLGDDWLDQVLLAYVACGLLLAGRRAVPERHRAWCVRLAARAAYLLTTG